MYWTNYIRFYINLRKEVCVCFCLCLCLSLFQQMTWVKQWVILTFHLSFHSFSLPERDRSKNTNCIFYSLKFLLGNAIPYRTFLCVGPTPMQLSSGNCLQLLIFPANFWFSFLNCTEHSGPFIPYSPTVLQNHPSIQLQPAIPRINSASSESNKSI